MVELQYVDSSNLKQVGYDTAASELHIIFNDGSAYIYSGVPEHVFEQLLEAPSKGSFLNREIKNAYEYRRA